MLRKPLTGALLLLATALIVYQPAWHGGPLWDDDAHMTAAALRSTSGLARIWLEPGATQQYYPVTHSVFWVLATLFGDDTLPYHLLTITLHAAVAILVWRLLVRLHVAGAELAAAIFVVHPINAESVAWLSELKNTLSSTLGLSAALLYLHYLETRRAWPFAAATIAFVLALLAKSVVCVIPAALVLVVFWRADRLRPRWPAVTLTLGGWLAIGLAAAVVTASVERGSVGAAGDEFAFTIWQRLAIAGRAPWFYLGKLAWPIDLAFFYPRWALPAVPSGALVWTIGTAVVTVGAAIWSWRRRAAGVAWLLYLVGLAPALGFVTVFPFRYAFVANHFAYLAVIPAMAAAAWALVTLRARSPAAWRGATTAGIAVFVVLLGARTYLDAAEYRDVDTLYRETLVRNPDAWAAHTNLAARELQKPSPDLAFVRDHAEAALRLNPGNAEAHNIRGVFLQETGHPEAARQEFAEAMRLLPGYADAMNNMGLALQALGRPDEAVKYHERAEALKPGMAATAFALGNARLAQGRFDEAAAAFTRAIALDAHYSAAYNNLGATFERLGRLADAADQFRAAIREADSATLRVNLGRALMKLGRAREAVAEFQTATRLDPSMGAAHHYLADILADAGDRNAAIATYRRAIPLETGEAAAQAHNSIGVLLAETGRLDEAAAEFRAALQLSPSLESARRNLARTGR